jgi:hypothetical protein
MPSYNMDMHNNRSRQEVKEERIAVKYLILKVSQSGRSGGTMDRQFPPQKDLNWGGVLDNRVPASRIVNRWGFPNEGVSAQKQSVQGPLFL